MTASHAAILDMAAGEKRLQAAAGARLDSYLHLFRPGICCRCSKHIRITHARALPPELERGSSANGWSETSQARTSLVVIRGILNFDYTAALLDRARLLLGREIGPRSSIRIGLKARAKALQVGRE